MKQTISYYTGFPDNCLLDLFLPATVKNAPGVLMIHGGGWSAGNREQWHPLARKLADAGFVTASASYRLAPQHRFPAQIEDVRAAMAWLKGHMKAMGADPTRIGAVGSSAGGHLVALLATIGPEDTLGAAPWLKDPDTRPRAVACYNPALNFLDEQFWLNPVLMNAYLDLFGGRPPAMEDIYRRASPALRISGNEPPFLFLNGTADELTPTVICEDMIKRLRERNVSADLMLFEGMEHGFSYALVHPEQIRAANAVVEFFSQKL
ncbi:MAG: alpha/beta hydrolase [Fibrobacterota bacterium]